MEDYFCGGVDTFVINLINNWPYQSDEIILACNRGHSGLGLLRSSIARKYNLVVHGIKTFTSFFEHPYRKNIFDKFTAIVFRILSPVLRYLFLAYNILALKKVLLEDGPDRLLVVNNGYPAGDSCRAAAISWQLFSKKPLSIHNFHGIALKPGWHIRLQEQLVDMLVSRASRIFVSVSRSAAQSMSCRNFIYRNNKVTFVYNGIGISNHGRRQDASDLKFKLGIPAASQLCLMLGAYHSNKNFNKGHDFLLRAFKKVLNELPNTHLLICGYGFPADIEKVWRLVLGHSIEGNIHLSGFRDDIHSLLSHTDIVLIASQAFESFCLASIEAMAHSVPVVATNVGAIPEIVVDGQGGYCVDKNDIDGYVKHIISLLSDNTLREEQGRMGFERYRELFTAHRMSQEYARLVRNV